MSEVEEILADQSKAVKGAITRIDARYFKGGKLKDEKQRLSMLNEYHAILNSYYTSIAIADGRIPDYFSQQFEARKALLISNAKHTIQKALIAAPPGNTKVSDAAVMKQATQRLENELLKIATMYDERFNAIFSHAKLSEEGIPLYLYLISGNGNSCEVCAASNLKLYALTAIDFELPRHPNCKCTLVPFTEKVERMIDEYYVVSEDSEGDTVLDAVQALLDAAGLIPGYGEIADGINALIYFARGDEISGALSAAAMIPFAGWTGTGGKYVHKAMRYADEAVEAGAKIGKEAAQALSQKEFRDMVEAALREATTGKAFRGGRAGEEILEEIFGGIPQRQYKTAITYRYVDLLTDNVIRESKVGYKAMTEELRKQAIKDSLIMAEEGVAAEWHFFRSEITGKVGADKRLLDLLDELGIEYFIHS